MQEQRKHAGTQQDEADVWQVKAREVTVLMSSFEDKVTGNNHDSRNESTQEKIDWNLPAPDMERRIDLRVGAGCCKFVHTLNSLSNSGSHVR